MSRTINLLVLWWSSINSLYLMKTKMAIFFWGCIGNVKKKSRHTCRIHCGHLKIKYGVWNWEGIITYQTINKTRRSKINKNEHHYDETYTCNNTNLKVFFVVNRLWYYRFRNKLGFYFLWISGCICHILFYCWIKKT